MKTIDADGSGTIDRIEWMMYLVTPDPSSKLETYDLHLRSLFDKFDLDRNGKIDQEELEEFLESYF
jgi:Ca2+-binding EF-hand superfamily protein